MNREQKIHEMTERAARDGVAAALRAYFGSPVRIELGFSARVCETELEEIPFSVRAMNALKRAGIFTIGELSDAIAEDRLIKIRNLGQKSLHEIRGRVLQYGYEQLSDDEKRSFFRRCMKLNGTTPRGSVEYRQ